MDYSYQLQRFQWYGQLAPEEFTLREKGSLFPFEIAVKYIHGNEENLKVIYIYILASSILKDATGRKMRETERK